MACSVERGQPPVTTHPVRHRPARPAAVIVPALPVAERRRPPPRRTSPAVGGSLRSFGPRQAVDNSGRHSRRAMSPRARSARRATPADLSWHQCARQVVVSACHGSCRTGARPTPGRHFRGSPDYGHVTRIAGSSPSDGYVMGIIGSRSRSRLQNMVQGIHRPIMPNYVNLLGDPTVVGHS